MLQVYFLQLGVSLGHGRDSGREISPPQHRLQREAATVVDEIEAPNRRSCRTSHCTSLSATMKKEKKERRQLKGKKIEFLVYFLPYK
uniref:Uncharacterized protein n=1 Tax=Cannabis sativa TaxID=3483 RepID=A0A803NLG4_CANSA